MHRASIDGMEVLMSALEVDTGEAPQIEVFVGRRSNQKFKHGRRQILLELIYLCMLLSVS